jgi:hypothetical protein
MSLDKAGRLLFVANPLPKGRSDLEHIAAVVEVINPVTQQLVKDISLPNGSTCVKEIRLSTSGRYAAVTHLVGSFNRATTRVQMGWLYANAFTLIDTERLEVLATVLLDTPGRGAADPWGVAWSADERTLVVTHAGTHEISIIDFPSLLLAIKAAPSEKQSRDVLTYLRAYEGFEPGLPFLTGARTRVKLPEGDLGPRSLAIIGATAYVTNYFSDTVSVIDIEEPNRKMRSIRLAPKQEMSLERKGELYFHDARICYQGWMTCASCHPGEGRSDGLNWDLLNDGIGNPKNTKSLLFAHRTPPAMSLGVRDTAETAVRAGIKHILFTDQPEEVAAAIDAYLKSLKPVPSPLLENGKLSASAQRGEKLFSSAGCVICHPPGLFTDQKSHDVGTRAAFDKPTDRFDTPTLVEVWRTAPYLHDGSAATIRDVLTTRNLRDQHGKTSELSPQEVEDLCAYVLSI